MEPVTLAAVTSAITVLGTKVAEGVATEAGKTMWERVLKLFGWSAAPPVAGLAHATAEHLQSHPEHAVQAIQVLKQDAGSVGMLVGRIDAEKVVVAQSIHTINM
jgi:type II secretory pathway predicted ATPase ExeA